MIIAADSGGSKTLLRVCDCTSIVEDIHMEGFGAALDSTEDIPALSQTLSQLGNKYPIEAIAFNLGGRNKAQIENILQRVFPGIPFQVFRESEGNAALALASYYNSQCILLAGTGTIAIGKHPQTEEMILSGGWGYLLGDQGSGYHIGITALQHAIDQMDRTAPLDMLSQCILDREDGICCSKDITAICGSRDAVFYQLSPLTRSHIASYARVVAACCAEQDPVSLKIMADAGKNMADIVAKALRKLKLSGANGILVTGGLLNTRAYWQESFENTLNTQFQITEFHYVPDGVIRGTQIIAANLAQAKH